MPGKVVTDNSFSLARADFSSYGAGSGLRAV
jgi:hypothetical protein